MQKKQINFGGQKPTIRFRRWSRLKFAAFASLTACVTIGQVKGSVSENLLKKQESFISNNNQTLILINNSGENFIDAASPELLLHPEIALLVTLTDEKGQQTITENSYLHNFLKNG